MRDSLLIQTALLELLEDAVIIDGRAEPVPIFDEATEKTPAPYIVLGEMTEAPADTHDGFGTSETCTLHFWSGGKGALPTEPRARGAAECKRMMGAVDELVHQVTATLEDGRKVRLTREFSELMTEELEDGERWRHGVMRVRARTLNLRPLEEEYA